SLDRLAWTPETGSVESNFNRYVRSITKATLLIGNLEEAPIEKGDFENRIIAEARALRAFYAFNLLDLYGPVPIIVDFEEAKAINSETQPERPTEAWIVDFIATELNAVIPSLPESYDSQDYGRVTKGAALTMLMKLQLQQKDWQGVLDSSDEIMSLGYQLMPTYTSIFDIENEGASNTETIFVVPKLAQDGGLAYSWFAACLPQTPEYKSPTGIKYSIWGGLKTPWPFYDKFEEGVDLRLSRLIRYYEDIDGNMVDFREVQNNKAVGAAPKKYGDDPEHNGYRQGNDVIIYRYADVLLARAEAINEISGPTAEAMDLVDQIRARAGVSETSRSLTQSSFRDFILDERGRELWCEGHRRQDLIRHGKFISTAEAEGFNPAGDHLRLYPIPQSARNENPEIGQNPGY
ncbi:MAG: RagB/SusD family nutrient uptake outer membrane protein, partial [Pricia sp.]